MSDHAVIVRFAYGDRDLDDLFELEDQLEAAIEQEGVGEYDGNEVAVDGSEATLYMYGPDAERLFSVVRPILAPVPYMKGAEVLLRFGPPEAGVP